MENQIALFNAIELEFSYEIRLRRNVADLVLYVHLRIRKRMI